jgi:predicted lipoprotein with Yx(FWY)xxD motif
MKRLIPTGLVAAVAIVAVVVISGCGGSSYGSSSKSSSTTAKPSSTSAGATISTAGGPLGKHLVDSTGRTLYLFEADKTNQSNCPTACLGIWPAYSTTSRPTAKGDVAPGKIGMAKAQNGKSIVTYNGHPLYYYAADQKPGDTGGQGLDQFGAEWYVVSPSGDKIDKD